MHRRLLLPLLFASLVTLGATAATSKRQTEADLKAVRTRIETVTRQISRDAGQRDRLTRDLKRSELALSEGREELARLQGEQTARRTRRAALKRDREAEQARIETEQASLAMQLRAAYASGGTEPLRLLFDQNNLAQMDRMFVYYGYFSRARADQIASIRAGIARIEALDVQLAAEEARLDELQGVRKRQLEKIAGSRDERARVLASLQDRMRSREQNLAQLKTQQADLEKLLRELARSLRTLPPDVDTPFGRLRGKLAWPVQGRLAASFGEERASGVRWEGVVVATEREAPVRAVAAGRVVFADWLPGLGLLTILDHGSGYLSLYGYNASLSRTVGTQVQAGEVIAAAGDTGGRSRPELYFEIRQAGKPVNPQPWFRSQRP